ncbi:hypothetical protein CerSpe_238360 [Prunus speciosa]
MTVHFHGADVKLESGNTFLRHNEEILCFAFAPDGYYGTYGNLAQMNFLVGYDLQKHTVSFKQCQLIVQSSTKAWCNQIYNRKTVTNTATLLP